MTREARASSAHAAATKVFASSCCDFCNSSAWQKLNGFDAIKINQTRHWSRRSSIKAKNVAQPYITCDRFGLVGRVRRRRGRRGHGGPLHTNVRATETHAQAIR